MKKHEDPPAASDSEDVEPTRADQLSDLRVCNDTAMESGVSDLEDIELTEGESSCDATIFTSNYFGVLSATMSHSNDSKCKASIKQEELGDASEHFMSWVSMSLDHIHSDYVADWEYLSDLESIVSVDESGIQFTYADVVRKMNPTVRHPAGEYSKARVSMNSA